ncbi:peptidylprolyl isomerase [Coraliomargarita akajimensis]|nr:peptidylprolyl isomerase [Coraliomargarita akajimensis]
MKSLLLATSLTLSLAANLHAQIYADVSVSAGASPLGTFRIQLHHDKAPRTVANFIGLATGQRNWIDPSTGQLQVDKPYYDGLIFHRLIHNFMIQGGDPLGTGSSGPGYIFQDEFDPSLTHTDYAVSMANSGANSNGSQFFITLSAPSWLDNLHSVFGEVIDDASYPNSRALIDGFKNSTNFPTTNDRPDTPITIDSIHFSGPDYASFDIHDASHQLPPVSALSMQLQHVASTGDFYLRWDAQRKHDYPLYYGADLINWQAAGNLLSMDDIPNYQVDITGIATTDTSFYRNCQVDYSAVADAPQNILAAGNSFALQPNGGTLTLNFDGLGGGTWTFVYSDGITPNDSGNITSSTQTNNSTYPVPTSGSYISSRTYARFLSLRQITVYLDGAAGPDQLTAIQPLLSFHETNSGWFDGAVLSTPANARFRGSFLYTVLE